MLEDAYKAAQQSVFERLSSPLIFSFALAWAGWNYKFVMILLSSNTVSTTLEFIEQYAFPDARSIWIHGVLLPLGSALVYVFGFPFIGLRVQQYNLWREGRTEGMRSRMLNETPMTQEAWQRARVELAKERRVIAKESADLYDEVKSLRDAVMASDKAVAQLTEERDLARREKEEVAGQVIDRDAAVRMATERFTTLEAEVNRMQEHRMLMVDLTPLKVRILLTLSNPGHLPMEGDSVAEHIGGSATVVKSALRDLVGGGFVQQIASPPGDPIFQATQLGRSVVKNWEGRDDFK